MSYFENYDTYGAPHRSITDGVAPGQTGIGLAGKMPSTEAFARVMASPETRAWLAALSRRNQSMSFADFHNTLRILRSIDFNEVSDFMASQDWVDFKRNPADYFIRADDEEQALLWRVIEARSQQRAA